MSWPAYALLGPGLWALAFAAVYALHGTGCALGWPAVPLLWGNLHTILLQGAWAVALLAAGTVLLLAPRAAGTGPAIARAGAWIGLIAVLLTLFPVLGLGTCGA